MGRKKWFLLMWIVVLVGCSVPETPEPPVDTSAADEQAVRNGVNAWVEAWNAQNTDAFRDMYTENAVQLAPDLPAIQGREAIVQGLADYFNEFDAEQSAQIDEVAAFGDVAIARGTWRLTQTPKAGGDPQVRSGKWFTFSSRQADGSWKVSRWIWNEDAEAD